MKSAMLRPKGEGGGGGSPPEGRTCPLLEVAPATAKARCAWDWACAIAWAREWASACLDDSAMAMARRSDPVIPPVRDSPVMTPIETITPGEGPGAEEEGEAWAAPWGTLRLSCGCCCSCS